MRTRADQTYSRPLVDRHTVLSMRASCPVSDSKIADKLPSASADRMSRAAASKFERANALIAASSLSRLSCVAEIADRCPAGRRSLTGVIGGGFDAFFSAYSRRA